MRMRKAVCHSLEDQLDRGPRPDAGTWKLWQIADAEVPPVDKAASRGTPLGHLEAVRLH